MTSRAALLCFLLVGCATTPQQSNEMKGVPLIALVGTWDCEINHNVTKGVASIMARATWTEVLDRDGQFSSTGNNQITTVNQHGQREQGHVEMTSEGTWSATTQNVKFEPSSGRFVPKTDSRLSKAMAAEKHQKRLLEVGTENYIFEDDTWIRKSSEGFVAKCQRHSA